jgi:hypothetical protein
MAGSSGSADCEAAPAIPVRLAGRPVTGDLAAPWISMHHVNGTPVLGTVDHARQVACLARCWCQACGQLLTSPLVLFARARDIAVGYVADPGLHPECAAYSAAACPMLRGSMRRYRSAPRPLRQQLCGDPRCTCPVWLPAADSVYRAGHEAEAFAAIWISLGNYRLRTDGRTGEPVGIAVAGIRILKVRPTAARGTPAQPWPSPQGKARGLTAPPVPP